MHIVNGFVQKLFSEVFYTEIELKYPALKSYDYNFGGKWKISSPYNVHLLDWVKSDSVKGDAAIIF